MRKMISANIHRKQMVRLRRRMDKYNASRLNREDRGSNPRGASGN
jgi:hypothetical protein